MLFVYGGAYRQPLRPAVVAVGRFIWWNIAYFLLLGLFCSVFVVLTLRFLPVFRRASRRVSAATDPACASSQTASAAPTQEMPSDNCDRNIFCPIPLAAPCQYHLAHLYTAVAELSALVCYAVEANGNLSIIIHFACLVSGFAIVSGGEWYAFWRQAVTRF